MLDLKPAIRFQHVGTGVHMAQHEEEVRQELLASPQRYVVSDIMRVLRQREDAEAPGLEGPLSLPPKFPPRQLQYFPWNQPIVFRSGRYVVHKVVNPIGSIHIPKQPFIDPEDDDGSD
jgi:hypothetical protein